MSLTKLLIAVLVASCFSCVISAQGSGQSPSAPKGGQQSVSAAEFFGEVKGNVYTNRFFKFSLSVPGSYTILARNEIEIYSDAGADAIGGKKGTGSTILDVARQNTVNLFAAAQKPPGSPDNSAIEIIAVRQPETATAELTLAATVKVMMGTGKYTVTQNLPNTILGGRSFSAVEFEMSAFGPLVGQRTFVTMQSGYSIMITIMSPKQSGFAAFDDVLKSIRFVLN